MAFQRSQEPREAVKVYPAHGGRVLVRFRYSQEGVERIRRVPGRKWEADAKCWSIPSTLNAARRLASLFRVEHVALDDTDSEDLA